MLLETDFSLDCKGLSSVPGLTALDFGQDSRSVGTGYTKTPNLISRSGKGVVGNTNVFVDKPKQTGFWEGLVFFLVANIQPIINIQKLQLHLVIIHLLLWVFFTLPAWTLFIQYFCFCFKWILLHLSADVSVWWKENQPQRWGLVFLNI